MADALAARLRALELELAEGDITYKGYEKKRAALLGELEESSQSGASADARHPPPRPRRDSSTTNRNSNTTNTTNSTSPNPPATIPTNLQSHTESLARPPSFAPPHPYHQQHFQPYPQQQQQHAFYPSMQYPPHTQQQQQPYPGSIAGRTTNSQPDPNFYAQHQAAHQPYGGSPVFHQYHQSPANASYPPAPYGPPFATMQQFRTAQPPMMQQSPQFPHQQPPPLMQYHQQQQHPLSQQHMPFQSMAPPHFPFPTFRPIADLDYVPQQLSQPQSALPPPPPPMTLPFSPSQQQQELQQEQQQQNENIQNPLPSQRQFSTDPLKRSSDDAYPYPLPRVSVSNPSPREAPTLDAPLPAIERERIQSASSFESLVPSDVMSSPRSSAPNSPTLQKLQLHNPSQTEVPQAPMTAPTHSGPDLSIRTDTYEPLDPNFASADTHTPRQPTLPTWPYAPMSAYATSTPSQIGFMPPPDIVPITPGLTQAVQQNWSPLAPGAPYSIRSSILSMPRAHHHAQSPAGQIHLDYAAHAHRVAHMDQQTLPTIPNSPNPDIRDEETNISLSDFTSITMLLRHRAHHHVGSKKPAFVLLDQRNRELGSFPFERLYHRALRVAELLREKSGLERGTSVALLFRRTDWLDFLSALFGCFLAGIIAVPLVTSSLTVPEELAEIEFILESSQLGLCLTTDTNVRLLTKLYATSHGSTLPKLEWWRINEFGSFQFSKRPKLPGLPEDPAWVTAHSDDQADKVAYVEYVKNAYGEVKGVAVHHGMILNQCTAFKDMYHVKKTDTIGVCLEPRQNVGLLLAAFASVYTGCTSVLVPENTLTTSGTWSSCIQKHNITVFATDVQWTYRLISANKSVERYKKVFNPATNPSDLKSLRTFIVNTESVLPGLDDVFMAMFAPVGLAGPHILSVLFTLNEFGGAILASDYNSMGTIGKRATKHTLRFKDILHRRYMSSTGGSDQGSGIPGTVVVQDSGVVIPHASVAIVDDDTGVLVCDGAFGEIWVHATNAPRSLWKLPKLSERTLCAHPTVFICDGQSMPSGLPLSKTDNVSLSPDGPATGYQVTYDYVRTGLYGYLTTTQDASARNTTETRMVVLGCARDIVFQRDGGSHVPVPPHQQPPGIIAPYPSRPDKVINLYFSNLLLQKMSLVIPGIECFTMFDMSLQHEFLPVVLLETTREDRDLVSAQVQHILEEVSGLRVFCVMVCKSGTLPRMYPDLHGGSGFQTAFSGFDMPAVRRVAPNSPHGVTVDVAKEEVTLMSVARMDVETCRRMFAEGRLRPHHVSISGHLSVYGTAIQRPSAVFNHHLAHGEPSNKHSDLLQIMGSTKTIPIIDDHANQDLTTFNNLIDLLIWRVDASPDVLAYTLLDSRGRESKTVTFTKFSTKVQSVARFLAEKNRLSPGDHVLVLCTHTHEFPIAIWACLYAGVICVPVHPPDTNRLKEDISALVRLVSLLHIKAVIVNGVVEDELKSRSVRELIKSQYQHMNATQRNHGAGGVTAPDIDTVTSFPPIINIARAAKTTQKMSNEDGVCQPRVHKRGLTAVITVVFDDDMRPTCTRMSHWTVLEQCRIYTIQERMFKSIVAAYEPSDAAMRSNAGGVVNSGSSEIHPFISCLRTYSGMGFLQTVFMGIYTGFGTLLVSPLDYFVSPNLWFDAIHRHHVRAAFAPYPMLAHAVNFMVSGEFRSFSLHRLDSFVIPVDGRPQPSIHRALLQTYRQNRISPSAIGITYTTAVNPMVSTRIHASNKFKPTTLWLDTHALRQRRIEVLCEIHGEDETSVKRQIVAASTGAHPPPASPSDAAHQPNHPGPDVLVIQDSGIVANNTFVAIVNVEHMRICAPDEVGEIWVCSGGTVDGIEQVEMTAPVYGDGRDAFGKPVSSHQKSTVMYSTQASHSAPAMIESGSFAGVNNSNVFEHILPGIDPMLKFVRTGHRGFLWPVPKSGVSMAGQDTGNTASQATAETTDAAKATGAATTTSPPSDPGHQPIKTAWETLVATRSNYDMVVFTLGSISDEIELDGLVHYPEDIEATVEDTSAVVRVDGSVVFVSHSRGVHGSIGVGHHRSDASPARLVVVIECADMVHFSATVPHIVASVLDRHGVLIRTMVMVQPGMLAKSRHNRKQRRLVAHAFESGQLPIAAVCHVGVGGMSCG